MEKPVPCRVVRVGAWSPNPGHDENTITHVSAIPSIRVGKSDGEPRRVEQGEDRSHFVKDQVFTLKCDRVQDERSCQAHRAGGGQPVQTAAVQCLSPWPGPAIALRHSWRHMAAAAFQQIISVLISAT